MDVANTSSKLALRRFSLLFKPDLAILVEPWMHFEKFISKWLQRLGLKMFTMNTKGNLLPNIWCICKMDMNYVIIANDNQHEGFTIFLIDITFEIAALYVSTCHLVRRNLWNTLIRLSQAIIPWCFIEDFNVIIWAHEHRVYHSSAITLIIEFQNWTETNDLFHPPLEELDLFGPMVEMVELL